MMQTARQLNGFVSDRSEDNLTAQLGFVESDGLIVSFFYDQVRIEDPLDPSGHGRYVNVLCARIRIRGDRLTQLTRKISEREAQQKYPREYAYFKQSHLAPSNGTPLHELPGVTQSQISILQLHNITSIEDLVSITGEQAQSIGMDAVMAHSLAAKWTKNRDSNGELIKDAGADAAMRAELDRFRASDASQKALIAAMDAKLELLTKMGVQGGHGQMPDAGSGTAIMVDSDDGVDAATSDTLFSGAGMVSGNDDLNEDPTPRVELPGLSKKPK